MTRHNNPSIHPQSLLSNIKLAELEQAIFRLEAEMVDLEWSQAEGEVAEVQELLWAMIDGEITEPQLQRLEEYLLEEPEARETMVECLQIHLDLSNLLLPETPSGTEAKLVAGVPASVSPHQT